MSCLFTYTYKDTHLIMEEIDTFQKNLFKSMYKPLPMLKEVTFQGIPISVSKFLDYKPRPKAWDDRCPSCRGALAGFAEDTECSRCGERIDPVAG